MLDLSALIGLRNLRRQRCALVALGDQRGQDLPREMFEKEIADIDARVRGGPRTWRSTPEDVAYARIRSSYGQGRFRATLGAVVRVMGRPRGDRRLASGRPRVASRQSRAGPDDDGEPPDEHGIDRLAARAA